MCVAFNIDTQPVLHCSVAFIVLSEENRKYYSERPSILQELVRTVVRMLDLQNSVKR